MARSQASRVGTVRRAKACNTCRRKKTKCDGKRPICSSCHAFNFSCTFQDTVKEPNRSSRAYVADLERRVQCMEEQLQRRSPSGKQYDGSLAVEDLSTSDQGSPMTRDASEDESVRGASQNSRGKRLDDGDEDRGSTDYESGIDQTSYVINGRDGKMRFFGASSALSWAAAHGANHQQAGPGMNTWSSAVRKGVTQWQLTSWYPRILRDDFEGRAFQPLPGKDLTMQLVEEYFADFNKAIPLFSKPSFMRLLERQFSWNPDESPSWWAALNVVLALAYRQRAQATNEDGDTWKQSLAHVRNAMNVTVEFFMRAADLLAVQAMLGLALYFQGTPNPQSLFMFASSAMRLAHSIGLHRGVTFGLTTPEIEERRRTFWIGFILDADISLRVGRPPAQDEHDYDTPLPSESQMDGNGILTMERGPIKFFRLLAELSKIQRRTYQHLYAATAQNRPRAIIVENVQACEDALIQWKKSLPLDFDSYPSDRQSSLCPYIIRLKFVYYSCYANLYRVCVLAGQSATSISTRPPIEGEIARTVAASIDSARSAVGLITQARLLGPSYQWNVLYFPAAASGTLALGIFLSPGHEKAKSDLSMICATVEYLSEISAGEPGTYVDHVLGVCSEFKAASERTLEHHRRKPAKQPGTVEPMGSNNDPKEHRSRTSFNEDSASAPLFTSPTIDNEHLNNATAQIQPSLDDLALFDLASDPLMNWQWSIPPFWNCQELSGLTPSSAMENENEQNSYGQGLGP